MLTGLNLIVIVLSLLWLESSKAHYHVRATSEAINVARTIEMSVTTAVRGLDIALQTIAADMERCLRATPCDRGAALAHTGLQFQEAQAFFFADAEGRLLHVLRTQADEPEEVHQVSVIDRAYFKDVRSMPSTLVISRPQVGKVTKRWALNLARPVRDAQGNFAGAVIASLDLGFLQSRLSAVNVGNHGAISLRDTRMGVIVRVPDAKSIEATVGSRAISDELQALLRTQPEAGTYRAVTPLDHIERSVAYQRSTAYPMYVNVGLSSEDYLAPWYRERLWTLSVLTVLVVLTMGVGYILLRVYRRQYKDMQHLRAAELGWRQEYEKSSALLKYATDGVHILDRSGRLVEANDQFFVMLGYERQELMNAAQPLWDIISTERINIPAWLADMFASHGERTVETRYMAKCGELIDVEINLACVETGGRPLLYAAARDVTDRNREHAELESYKAHLEELVADRTADLNAALIAAEAANVSKSSFLANMSHEIRTPLNAIMGMVHLIRRDGVGPTQESRLEKIAAASKHLLAVINDILDISKIEAGKLKLESAVVRPEQLLANITSILAEPAEAKGVKISVDAPPLPMVLLGDATRLQQAIINYMTNAIKFSHAKGLVALRMAVVDETADAVQLHFEVQDHGIGIPAEAIPRLFSAFEQADSSLTRQYGGTGLGLAITKRLAEMMGGAAGVLSIEGVGSTFWLTVWMQKVKQPATQMIEPMPASDAPYRGRVLLVEDEPINREVMVELLADYQVTVEIAEDGQIAVEKVAAGLTYDLVLMDMQMPRMDGLSATQAIRKLPGGDQLVIVALTANAFAEDRARCMAAGMDDFLAKPVEPDLLDKMLGKWLN